MQRIYSPFMATLYDQTEPVGDLGRGTHYSVLRTLTWHDVEGRHLSRAGHHDFAVVWDEDHDERVIAVVDELHALGLLFPVLFIGERKGGLSVIVDPSFADGVPAYDALVAQIAEGQPDPWGSEVVTLGSPSQIINAPQEDVALFLDSLRMLWSLGIKPSTPAGGLELEHGSTESLLRRVSALAKESRDGHFTIMQFTTHTKAALGTPDLDGGAGRREIAALPGFSSVNEALEDVLRTGRSL